MEWVFEIFIDFCRLNNNTSRCTLLSHNLWHFRKISQIISVFHAWLESRLLAGWYGARWQEVHCFNSRTFRILWICVHANGFVKCNCNVPKSYGISNESCLIVSILNAVYCTFDCFHFQPWQEKVGNSGMTLPGNFCLCLEIFFYFNIKSTFCAWKFSFILMLNQHFMPGNFLLF